MATLRRSRDTRDTDQHSGPSDRPRGAADQPGRETRRGAGGAAHRAPAAPIEPSELDLLDRLLEAPPAAAERRRPVALRSAAEQRRHALRGYQLRTWFDTVLQQTERLLMVTALLVFGYWLFDGPVRDWLHDKQASSTARPVAAASLEPLSSNSAAEPRAAAQVAAERNQLHSAPLPYVRLGTPAQPVGPAVVRPASPQPEGDARGDDFIAQRQRPLEAPVIAAPPQPSRLIMPSIGVDTPVREVFIVDGAWEVAEYAAGYLHGTGLPGDGNTVLAGHAGIRGAVFRDLGSLKPGDDVFLDAGGWRYHYRVRETKAVWPDQVEVLDPSPAPVLTMLTCTNWDTQRMVVVADLLNSKPSPGP